MSNPSYTARTSRRGFLVGMGSIVGASLIAGCASTAPSPQATKAPASQTTAAPAAKTTGAAKVLKLGSIQATSDPSHQGMIKFAELVAARSNGRYEVKLFPASQLGDNKAQADQVVTGALEMFLIGWGGLGPQVKDFDIGGFPVLFRDQEHAWKFANSPVGDELYEKLRVERNLRPLSRDWLWPPRQIVSKRPIKTRDDLKGLKMRVADQRVWSEPWKAMGVAVTPMAWGEVFTGLQQGVVEAVEGPSTQLVPMKFTDVAKNVTLTNHTKFIVHIIVNDKWFQDLSKEDQTMFVDCSKEAAAYGNKLVQQADATFVEDVKKMGVNVITVDPGFLDPMKELPAKFEADGLWSKGLFQKIQDVK